MYKSIAIIGSGSLGSFIAYSISQLDQIEKIVLIDHDIVLQKNLRNTKYKKKNIGRLKVDALKDIILDISDIEVKTFNKKFIENNMDLSDYDLVLDCRDFTYNRTTNIHTRLYISSRYLVVDCRKNISYEKQYKGKYLSKLTKTDLRNAGIIFSILIENNKLIDLIKFQSVNRFDLDYLKNEIQNNQDILYESNNENFEKQLINLPENITNIINRNKHNPIDICIGNKENPIYKQIIPTNLLHDSKDLINTLGTALTISPTFNTFIVSFQKRDEQYVLELIPETGAA